MVARVRENSSLSCSEAGVSWALTREISPRRTVRVYVEDASGTIVNSCPTARYMSAGMPSTTWAMNLAGTDGLYRFVCFDLDAKTPEAAERVPADLQQLTQLLDELRIAYVVCASGPTGGRHVWIALAEHQAGDRVAQLARFARAMLPTLDITPLSNPATGCVRPPGAPHRSGGASVLLQGTIDTLRVATTTGADIAALLGRLEAIAAAQAPDPDTMPAAGPLPVDDHGHIYLPGARRPLAAAAAVALDDQDAALGDASATLWTILLGAAAARWRHEDVAVLVNDRPGLEHVRTVRDRSGRARRPLRGPNSAAAVLRRQWDKAVRQIASSDRQGSDPTFEARAAAIAAHVRGLQARADAAHGRWHHHRSGPADRRVLDVLSALALEAVSCRLEADIRRVALLAGIGRETARTALQRLARDGWIAQAAEAAGPHAAHWTIDPQNVFPRETDPTWSQADPPRGSAERSSLLRDLHTRTSAARHDVFTPSRALGLRTGNLYARLTDTPQTSGTLALQLGAPLGWVVDRLIVLELHGLARADSNGWTMPAEDLRDAIAVVLEVDGRLEARRRRYELERELWAWWQAEQVWMNTPPHKRERRRPGPGQLALLPDVGTNRHGAHPRREDGTADFGLARSYIEHPALHTTVPGPVPVTGVDRLVAEILGGCLVRTERHGRVPVEISDDVGLDVLVGA